MTKILSLILVAMILSGSMNTVAFIASSDLGTKTASGAATLEAVCANAQSILNASELYTVFLNLSREEITMTNSNPITSTLHGRHARPATAEELTAKANYEAEAMAEGARRRTGRMARKEAAKAEKAARIEAESEREKFRELKKASIKEFNEKFEEEFEAEFGFELDPSFAEFLDDDEDAKTAVIKAAYIASVNQAKREMAIDAREQKLEESTFPHRTVSKCDKIKIKSYKHHTVSWDRLIPDVAEIAGKINSIAHGKSGSKTLDIRALIAPLYKAIEDAEAKSEFKVTRKDMRLETGRQSLATDIAGVLYGGFDATMLKVDAPVANIIHMSDCLQKAVFGDNAKEALDKINERLVKLITKKPIRLGDISYGFWGSSPSMQKVGRNWFGDQKMLDRIEPIILALRSWTKLSAKGTTGNAELKYNATLFTPSAVLVGYDGVKIRLNDVILVRNPKRSYVVPNAMIFDNLGGYRFEKNHITKRVLGDGAMYLIHDDAPSHQARGPWIKGCCIAIQSVIDGAIVKREVIDYDGIVRNIDDYKVLMTDSCLKIDMSGLTWSGVKEAVAALKYLFDDIDALRVVRYADSTEEDKPRHLARQAVQQWITANDEDIDELLSKTAQTLLQQKTLSGVLARKANPLSDTPNAMEWLFQHVPGLLNSKQFRTLETENWLQTFADASSGSFGTSALYPYITEDPVALLQVIVDGWDPEDPELGLLKEGTVNMPNTAHGEEFAAVRFPANFFTMTTETNDNEFSYVYESCGNVCILSVRGLFLIIHDGDVDGDEAHFNRNHKVIEMVKKMRRDINIPVIIFDHDSKNEKAKVHNREEYLDLVAHSLYLAQVFNFVGRFSTLATTCMSAASDAHNSGDVRLRNKWILYAAFAHVGTILAIDLVKTGNIPLGLMAKLESITKEADLVPYNQRFNKHNSVQHFWDSDWDQKTKKPGKGVVDRLNVRLSRKVGYHPDEDKPTEYGYDTEGVVFRPEVLLDNTIPMCPVPMGKLTDDIVEMLNLANYGDNTLRINSKDGHVGAKDLMIYCWQNASSLKYRLSKSDNEAETEATLDDMAALLGLTRMAILTLPELGRSKSFDALSTDERDSAIVNWFVRNAFELDCGDRGNGIGSDAGTAWDALHLKASYAKFVVMVFAKDIIHNVERNLMLDESECWVDPATRQNIDDILVNMF